MYSIVHAFFLIYTTLFMPFFLYRGSVDVDYIEKNHRFNNFDLKGKTISSFCSIDATARYLDSTAPQLTQKKEWKTLDVKKKDLGSVTSQPLTSTTMDSFKDIGN